MVGGLGWTEWGGSHEEEGRHKEGGMVPGFWGRVGGRHTEQEQPKGGAGNIGLLADHQWQYPLPERSFPSRETSSDWVRLPR